MESLHNSDDEPLNDAAFSFEFEHEDLSRERVQELIWEELREYHPSIAENYPSASPSRRKPKQSLATEPDTRADSKNGSEVDDDKDGGSKATKKRSITPVGAGNK